jgi:hypothetical protein
MLFLYLQRVQKQHHLGRCVCLIHVKVTFNSNKHQSLMCTLVCLHSAVAVTLTQRSALIPAAVDCCLQG